MAGGGLPCSDGLRRGVGTSPHHRTSLHRGGPRHLPGRLPHPHGTARHNRGSPDPPVSQPLGQGPLRLPGTHPQDCPTPCPSTKPHQRGLSPAERPPDPHS